jgi:glycerol uptake facilitator-like aquaporin
MGLMVRIARAFPVQPLGRHSDRALYAGVFILAALPRLLYLLLEKPPFDSDYWTLAGSLLRDGSLSFDGTRTTAFEPAYPLFLAMARVLSGHSVLLVQVIQCMVAACGAVFLYRLASSLTGARRVAVIAAVLYAGYPLLIRHSPDPTDAALMTTLLIAFAAGFVNSTTARSDGAPGTPAADTPMRAARAGIWLGLAVLTRTMALPLIPLAAAIHSWQGASRSAGALTVTAFLVITPYAVRNYALNGSVLPTRSGLNLFISNSAYTASIFPAYGPDILQEYAWSVLLDRTARPPLTDSPALERELDAAWTGLALQEMRRDPLRTAGLKARNVLYFFSPRLVPYHEPTEATRILLGENGQFRVENSPPRRTSHQVIYAVSYTPVLALAVAGAWLRRRDIRRDAILWCVVVTFVAAHAIYFPTTRYRVPIEFVLLFYASVALDRWISRQTRSEITSA